jgi:hypothetical protein
MTVRRRARVWPIATVMTVAVTSGSFALGAANTLPSTKAGDGAAPITGFVVSGVSYSLNASNPSNVDAVSFTVDVAPPAGSTKTVQLAPGGPWYTCTNVGTAVSCVTTAPQATVAGTSTLRVVIAQ